MSNKKVKEVISEVGFEPWGMHILIELPDVEKQTKSGIYKSEEMMAEEATEMDEPQLVVAVGDECKKAKVGMRIKIKNHSVPVMTIHGKRYAVVEEYTVVGRILDIETSEKIEA